MPVKPEQQPKPLDSEEVHFVIDYWDGPREGVADYDGTPHYFRAVFDEKRDEWSDVFILSPLDLDSHPALSDDANRSKELAEIIEPKIEIDPIRALKLRGSFEADDRTKLTSNRKWRVRWLPIA